MEYKAKEVFKKFEHRTIYLGAKSGFMWIGKGIDAVWASKILDVKIKEFYRSCIKNAKGYVKRLSVSIPEREKEAELLERRITELGEEMKAEKEANPVGEEEIKAHNKKLTNLRREIRVKTRKLEEKRKTIDTARHILETKISSIESNLDYINNYVPILERVCVDVYKKPRGYIDEPLGVAVKVEGRENGDYWQYSEFNADEWL